MKNNLHPSAVELAKVEACYAKAAKKLAAIKEARRAAKANHRAAIIAAIKDAPEASHVDLAALFNVVEGTIRHIRRELDANGS